MPCLTELEEKQNVAAVTASAQKKRYQLIDQAELNSLIRDLQLSQEKAELLFLKLKQWRLLARGTKLLFLEDEATER